MCRIVLHPCGDPGSALLRVRFSDHQAHLAAQCCSDLRHLLRGVDASAVNLVPGFRRSSLHFWVHHWDVSAWCCGVGIDIHALQRSPSISNSISRFQRSSLFRLDMLRHDTAALLLTMCSPALVLKHSQPTVQPVHSEFLLWPRRLVWFERGCVHRTRQSVD